MKKRLTRIAIFSLIALLGLCAYFFVSPIQVKFTPSGMVEDSESETGLSCPKHKTALVSKRGFFADGPVVQGTEDYYEVADRYPGSIPFNGSLTKSYLHKTPALLIFCEQCETGVQNHLSGQTLAAKE